MNSLAYKLFKARKWRYSRATECNMIPHSSVCINQICTQKKLVYIETTERVDIVFGCFQATKRTTMYYYERPKIQVSTGGCYGIGMMTRNWMVIVIGARLPLASRYCGAWMIRHPRVLTFYLYFDFWSCLLSSPSSSSSQRQCSLPLLEIQKSPTNSSNWPFF